MAERLEEEEKNKKDVLPTESHVWYVVQSYFERYGFVRHQIESFDRFLHELLPHIIHESPNIQVIQGEETHTISLCNLSVMKPCDVHSDGTARDMLPHMARLKQATYASPVLVDVVHDIHVGGECVERRLFRETCLLHIPIMLGSSCCHTQHTEKHFECPLDQGGYFIVSGVEKVLVAQEKLHHNTPYVFEAKQPSRFALQCEVRSCHERKLRSTSSIYLMMTHAKRGSTPELVAQLPFVNTHVPILSLLRLLGVKSKRDAMCLIMGTAEGSGRDVQLLSSILDLDPHVDLTDQELHEKVGRDTLQEATPERQQRYLLHILNCEVLPHTGLTRTPEVLRSKTLFLALMVRKLLQVYSGKLTCDDRDHMCTKRIDCAGTQFSLLFRQVFRGLHKSLSIKLRKAAESNKMKFTNVGNLVSTKRLTNAFRYALATGNWGILSRGGVTAQHGVSQQLGRMTSATTLSLLRKVSTPVARETKNPKPRQLHPTCWGLICPMDTPEGQACGLTKALSVMAHVRVGTFSDCVVDQLSRLKDLIILTLDATDQQHCGVPVLVNGTLLGYVLEDEAVPSLCDLLREMRRDGRLPFDTTIALFDGYLHVDTDPGCLMRPLLRVDGLKKIPALLKEATDPPRLIDLLLSHGVMEYVDKLEESNLRVALYSTKPPEGGWAGYTHCELDPSLIVGICGSLIPFADFNQSPRNTYQSAMMKQALGVYSITHPMRMDTISHILVSPQCPMVTTRMDAVVGSSLAPSGVNAIVCILCYTGQNQEDSLIVNRAALDRGMFRSVKLQTYRDEERQNGGSDTEHFEYFGNQDVAGRRTSTYDHLEPSGMVRVGARVKAGDVLISKTVNTREVGEGSRRTVKREKSTVLKHDHGIVDAVLQVTNEDNTHLAKVRVRCTRTPVVGDKLSSRMGQKGVIGAVLDPEDMPYTEDGMVPDIILNPHAIPSRMTCGQMVECLSAILCTLTGQRGDGTMFRGVSIEHICEQLAAAGYDRHGRTKLHSGFTGEAYESLIFMGPTYYQRLRHMAADKDHARARGPRLMLCRQPTEGRARHGGLRFGEMERDALISHGAAEFLRHQLLDNSDPAVLTVCGKCGNMAIPAAEGTRVRHKTAFCRVCGEGTYVQDMNTPFAFRLLLQELQAMSVAVRFEL